jgi:hypothetical protein
MKAGLLAMALILNAMPNALAEEPRALQLKSKAAIATVVPHRSAPYVQPLGEAQPEPLIPRNDPRHGESRSSCESDRTLCYDPNSGRIVYKPARQYMPELPGLRAENISVKRDRITFKYSF